MGMRGRVVSGGAAVARGMGLVPGRESGKDM
jgi:hypothetical protein